MICPKCGANNIDGSNFCFKCGSILKEVQSQEQNLNNNILTQNVQPMNTKQEQLMQQQPVYNQQPTEQLMNNAYSNTANNDIRNNKNSKSKLILIIIFVLIAILGIVFFFFFNKNKKDKELNKDNDINYSMSFFIKDSNGKYALFSEDGKNLTDFIFTYASDFVNGTTVVEKDNSYGIINENGKMTVDFGKYKYIFNAAGLYEVIDENYHSYLINGQGKVLYDMGIMDLDIFKSGYTYLILEDKQNESYKVLNYEGKTMTSFTINEDAEYDPVIEERDGIIFIFYDNKNYVLNAKTGKEIVAFDSNLKYCVSNVDEDGKTIIMYSCSFLGDIQNITYNKLIKDGKLYDLTDKCERISYSNGNILCSNDYNTYLLDANFNVGIETLEKAYVDNNTYATLHDTFDGIDFYNNGSFVKNVACRNLKETGYMNNGIYILKTYYSTVCGTSSGTYEYYKSNGEKAFDKTFMSAEKFDKNGLAEVSEDRENYYLIDVKGNKISQDYSGITLYSNYYIVTKNNLKGIIDKDGNVIVDCLYSKINIVDKQSNKYATLITADSKYIIYDIAKKFEIATFDSSPTLNKNYISILKDSKIQYYSYTTGKMFYETN